MLFQPFYNVPNIVLLTWDTKENVFDLVHHRTYSVVKSENVLFGNGSFLRISLKGPINYKELEKVFHNYFNLNEI